MSVSVYVNSHWICGWAPGSSTPERHYIDPTFPASAAAYALYGWVLVRHFELGAGTHVHFSPLPDPRDTAAEDAA
jgi:hypothetical protein